MARHNDHIAFDYRADGIWWVATREEIEASYEEASRRYREHHRLTSHRPWGDLLSDQLLDDLKAWNDSWEQDLLGYPPRQTRRHRPRSG